MTSADVVSGTDTAVSAALLRAAIYRALARGFVYPAPKDRQQVVREWRELLAGGLRWPAGVRSAFEHVFAQLIAADGVALEHEHVRLFGPGGRCPLTETAYGDAGRLLGKPSTLADVSGFYLAFGLQPSTTDPHPEDHLLLELEFMSVLALKEAYARSEGWTDHLDVTVDAQRKFLGTHLGTWIDAWAVRLAACGAPAYYRRLAEALATLVATDCGRLAVTPDRINGCVEDHEVGGDQLDCPRADS